jgi:serine phosphatase RsbU (regulator of sigma subunit)/ligand-binding sensor domain-containing protein
MTIKRLLLISYLSLFIINIQAQNHIIFHHLTVDKGLSQSSVTCILQDSKAFMWFGTQDGLNRYDGYKIKVFKNNPTDSTSLINNFIFSIYEDAAGFMYVETQGGGFQKYNAHLESFSRLKKNSVNLSGAKYNTVNAFFEDSDGVRWTGGMSAGTGLKRTDKKTGKEIIFRHEASNPLSLSDDKVYSVYRDRSENLWVGTFGGLDKLDEKTGTFIHYKNKPGDPNSLSDNWIWPIYEDTQGYLWFGTVRGGLDRFDPRTGAFVTFKNDPSDASSLNDNFIFSIYEDHSGVIWIGTNAGGVNYFLPSAQVFNLFRSKPDDKNWFKDNTIQSMYADRNGNYWIGTQHGGLYKFDYKKNLFTNYSHNPSSSNSISSNTIQSIFEDRSGIIWIGNFSSGLDEFNPKTNTFKHHTSNPSDSNSLSDNRIYSIVQGVRGNIWIGTYGGGLNRLDPHTGKITRFQYDKNNPNSISSNAVWSVAVDHSGKLWLGTFGGGMNVFDPRIFKATRILSNPKDPSSLADNNIVRVFIDKNDNVWAGTTKGLSEYNRQQNKFKNYREQDGLPNESVFGILEDNRGDLWISTNKGLSRFNRLKNTFKNYYSQDGLQGNEFNQNAFAKDNLTGQLMFGGPDGFNVFNPENVKDNSFLPPVVFTDYLRYNTDDVGGKPIFEKGISTRDSLFLTYKDNIINLQFSALSYYNTFQNRYQYKLEGFNKNWIQLENNNSVTFTNLSPGNYELRVIASNNDGLWNYKGASLFIKVTPPWWKTNIAYSLYIISFIGLLYLARREELRRKEQKTRMRENELHLKATEAEKRALEAENERKTKELEEARQMQLSMLPKVLPKLSNLEISAFMRTATEVGGDYYDFIVQDGGVLNVGFGDATGHGLQAGTMVTLMKGFFTSDAAKLELEEFMNHCSAMIKEIKLGRILMSFSLLRIKESKLELASAGMPPVYFYNGQTNDVEEILIQGMPLGAMKKGSYKMVEKELRSGDILLLLTDGLPEQMNNNDEMFDYSRVKSNFKEIAGDTPEVIIEKLVRSGDEWMGDKIQADDITLVVIKVK